ncbi:MAG: DUF4434 domain-containing protein [bacterium]
MRKELAGILTFLLFSYTLPSWGFLAITGSFLQLDGSNLSWKETEWRKELSYMKSLGMDTLIIAYVAWDSTSFYPSRFLSQFKSCGIRDTIETLLSLSDREKIDVYLGLYNWDWKGKGSEEDFKDFAELNIKVAKELHRLYSKHPSFKGWYILSWELGNAPPPENPAVKAYIKVADFLRRIDKKRKIVIAPYFTLDITPKELEEGWLKLLEILKVDILALQDGVGCDRGIKPEDIPSYFSAMKKAVKLRNVELWGDLEVFDILAGWKPAEIGRVKKQIEKMSPFVKKIVIWEFNHYMSPLKGSEQRKLYEDYKKLLKEVRRSETARWQGCLDNGSKQGNWESDSTGNG